MGLLSRIFKKQVNTNLFSFLFGISAPDMKDTDYAKAYKGWVYACVNAIAEEVASIELHLMRKTSGGVIEIDNHLVLGPLHNVNPFMSSSELFLATQAHLELNGNAFWYLPSGQLVKKPAEIWILDPTRVKVVKNQETFISGYAYQNEKGQNVPLEVSEVIHFKRFNPFNRYRGMGTVQAAALAIDIDTYSAQWNRNFFYNSALPSAVLETEGTLTEEQFNRIRARWESQYKGVDNAHKFAILEGGLKFNRVGMTQKEMDFLEQRRFSRDEILGIFRVPKTALLITDDVNRANAEATDYVFAKRVVKPRMKFIVDRLNEFYIPLFGLKQNEYFFKFTDPVPENIELEIKEEEAGLRAGWYMINEVRAKKGLPPVKNGDVIYQPISLMPIGGVVDKEKQIDGAATIIFKGEVKKDLVEKRVRFIRDEISKRKDTFQKILLDQKSYLIRRLKKEKSIKKDNENELVRFLFEEWNDWIGVLHNPIEDALKTSLIFAGKQTLQQLKVDIDFDLRNNRVLDWLAKNSMEHAKSVTGAVKEEIAVRIMEGVEQGAGIDQIADAINDFFDKQSKWRALRIARTEVMSGYGWGSLEAARQSGIAEIKRWRTMGDDRVSVECQMNEDDGWIERESPFSSGAIVTPQHPNCRCSLEWKRKQTEEE